MRSNKRRKGEGMGVERRKSAGDRGYSKKVLPTPMDCEQAIFQFFLKTTTDNDNNDGQNRLLNPARAHAARGKNESVSNGAGTQPKP